MVFALLAPRMARAETVRLALIVGVNRSVDRDVAELRFADDDAARYFDLFGALGTPAAILARMDPNTQRLHADASKASRLPLLAKFDEAIAELGLRAEAARKKGDKVVLYFVYAGHGNVKNGAGYISLEDARLTGKELEARVVAKLRPERTHFIVDACHSYYLAYARGPGGSRRKVSGFSGFGALGERSDVGVLLSTTSARESHEWERVQAGVFSHEVRSGLYGAADADQNGEITYREIAAFVARANAAIPNERYRPEVYARAPSGDEALLNLEHGLKRRVEIDGGAPAHYVLENENGVYIAEFHNRPHAAVRLVRPSGAGRLYMARVPDGKEFVIEAGAPDVVRTAELALVEPRFQSRGAAHEAFSRTFELPFSEDSVRGYVFPSPLARDELDEPSVAGPSLKRYVGFGLLGAGAVSGALGGVALYSAGQEKDESRGASQREIERANGNIDTKNRMAAVAFGASGAAVASGVVLLLWPESPVSVEAGSAQVGARFRGRF